MPEPRADVTTTTTEFRVRYAETDQMGVVYHANYLVWCEVGRTDLIRERYGSYAALERSGVVLAVSDVQLRYHASARYDDLIRVETRVDEVRSRSVTFGYRIGRVDEQDADGEAARLVSARVALIALDPDGRPRKLPAELVEALRA